MDKALCPYPKDAGSIPTAAAIFFMDVRNESQCVEILVHVEVPQVV